VAGQKKKGEKRKKKPKRRKSQNSHGAAPSCAHMPNHVPLVLTSVNNRIASLMTFFCFFFFFEKIKVDSKSLFQARGGG
jgi:hypothetical protein